MFFVIHNLGNGETFVTERRISSSAARTRITILQELDGVLRPNWRRGYRYNAFFDCRDRGLLTLEETYRRARGGVRLNGYIKVYVDEKSPATLASDALKLALAMAFHPRLGEASMLGRVDVLVMHEILSLAGLGSNTAS
jgi:hypothetical protein